MEVGGGWVLQHELQTGGALKNGDVHNLFAHGIKMPARMNGMPRPPAPPSAGGMDMHAASTNTTDAFRGGEHVALVGIRSQPQLNGRCGYVGEHDVSSGRFDVWVIPLSISSSGGGLKINWVGTSQADDAAMAVKVKPSNLQILNLTVGMSPDEQDFLQLPSHQRAAVLRAQKQLWDEAGLFRDGKRRPVNVVSLFSADRRPSRVLLVRAPQPGIAPTDLSTSHPIVVRRELAPEVEPGLPKGYIYAVASTPRVRVSFRFDGAADDQLLDGKAAADAFLRAGGR